MATGASEAETFWLDFLRSLSRRGLRGVKLVISDAHEGLKAAVTKVLRATWQRCRVHFGRTASAHAGKIQRRIVSAWIGTAYAQEDAAAAHAQWRMVADQLRPKVRAQRSFRQDRGDLLPQLLEDRRRRAGGGEDTLPHAEGGLRETRLGYRWHVRHDGAALGGGHGECPRLPGGGQREAGDARVV